jgi:LEA14-like dessication related protein
MKPGDIASTLVASKLRVVLLGVVVLCVVVVGAFAVGILGVPSVATIDNTFGEVTNETTTIETDLVISNPNPVGIGLEGVSVNYTVSMNSIEMAHGTRDGVGVEPGNSTMNLETRMRNDAIPPWWTSHIRNGERTTVGINATITSDRLGRSTDVRRTHEIETDLIGAFNSEETRPVNADSVLVDDPVLYINETRGQWGTVSETETPIEMAFEVYNPNVEPYVITEIGYDITMNDVAMGEGRTEEAYIIPSRGTETVELTTVLDNRQLDDW